MIAGFYEAQTLRYSCIPASTAMILRRYGHALPTQQMLIDQWCTDGEAERDVITQLQEPLKFRARAVFLGDPAYTQMMMWLAQDRRWIILFVSNYGLTCIAKLHEPQWTSHYGILEQLFEKDELDLRGALVRLNTLLPSHALVLCGYDHERSQVAVLDPFHDGAPRPIWIDEALLDQISTGHYSYPTTDLQDEARREP
jgi:hypothetical protein